MNGIRNGLGCRPAGCVLARLVVRAGSLTVEVFLSHLLARDIGRLHWLLTNQRCLGLGIRSMARVFTVRGVRFLLAGVLTAALAACFVGRAEAASVFSSSVASPSVFANSAASGARVVAGDRALL